MILYMHTCYMVSIWLWGFCMCSFCASLFLKCGRTQNNLWALIQNLQLFFETWASLSILFYIPAFSWLSVTSTWGLYYNFILWGELVLFNCHWQFAFRHCVLILHQKAVFTRVIRTWKLWIFLYVVPGLAHITAVIGVIVTLSNYFLWMSSGIFYYSAAMFLRCSYRLARQFHNSSNLCSNHHKQPSNALAII